MTQAEAGCEHSACITRDGELFTWGHGDSGRLGHGDAKTEKVPKKVQSLEWLGLEAISISVGDKYNMVLVVSRNTAEGNDVGGNGGGGHRHHSAAVERGAPVKEDADSSSKSAHGFLDGLDLNSHHHAPPIEPEGGIGIGDKSRHSAKMKPSVMLGSAWLLSNPQLEVPADHLSAVPSATAALIILAHLERLACGYLNLDYVFKPSERNSPSGGIIPVGGFEGRSEAAAAAANLFRPGGGGPGSPVKVPKGESAGVMIDWSNVQLSGAIGHRKWMSAEKIAQRPYCVDASFGSLQLLYRLVEEFSNEDPVASAAAVDDGFDDKDSGSRGASSDSVLKWIKDPSKLLFRRCVVRLCLGLLKANLHFLLSFRRSTQTSSSGSAASTSSTPSTEGVAAASTPVPGGGGASNASEGGFDKAQRHSIITKLHTLLQGLVKRLHTTSRDAPPVEPKEPTSLLSMSALSIQYEAAEVLKVGFELFYPTPLAKQTLLVELTQCQPQLHGMLLSALAERLSQDCVMSPLIMKIFTSQIASSLPDLSDPPATTEKAGPASSVGNSTLSASALTQILQTLLERSWQDVEQAVNASSGAAAAVGKSSASSSTTAAADGFADGFATEVPLAASRLEGKTAAAPATGGGGSSSRHLKAKPFLQLLSGLQKHLLRGWCSTNVEPWSSVIIRHSKQLLGYGTIPTDCIFCTGIVLPTGYSVLDYPYRLNILYWNSHTDWILCTGLSLRTEYVVLNIHTD